METVRVAPTRSWNRADALGMGLVVLAYLAAAGILAGPNSARRMRQIGVKYVVLHADRDPAPLEEALHSPDFRLIAYAGQVYLFGVYAFGRTASLTISVSAR